MTRPLVDWHLGRVFIGRVWPWSGLRCAVWAMSHLHTRVSQPVSAWCDLGGSLPSLSCEYIFLILGHQTPGHGPSVNIRIESERWGLHWGEKTLNGLVKCGILPQLLSALSVCFWNFMLENNQPDSTFREGKVEQNAHQLILHSSVSSFSSVVFGKLYSSRWTWTIKGFTCILYRHHDSLSEFYQGLDWLYQGHKN